MCLCRSIGIFTHAEEPGEIRLVHGCNVSMETLDYPDARSFFEVASSHVVPSSTGGQFDVFAPLAASGNRLCLIVSCALSKYTKKPVCVWYQTVASFFVSSFLPSFSQLILYSFFWSIFPTFFLFPCSSFLPFVLPCFLPLRW